MWERRHPTYDPHEQPEVAEALSVLDALDAKASGLGGMLGLMFAASMVFLSSLSADDAAQIVILSLAMASIGAQVAAIALTTSCLYILTIDRRCLLPTATAETRDAAVARFVHIADGRTRRYLIAWRLTFVGLGFFAVALVGYAAVLLR